jgi:HAE1 family hydrophobic/amphiphilic exporter-1
MKTTIALLATALAAGAQTVATTWEPTARIGIVVEAHLDLKQAISLALANNHDIESSRIDRDEAVYSLKGARGAYDPVIGGNSQWLKQNVATASSIGGSATGGVLTKIWQSDPSISGLSPWFGGSYRLDFNTQHVWSNNTFATINPQYPTAATFQFTQPLWRGLRYDANRHGIDVAKKNRSLTNEQFRLRVMTVVALTETAYWELVYAWNNLAVQVQAVEIARQQDESNRRQEAQGLLAPIDVVAAQTQLANFKVQAYNAQVALTRAENTLKSLILADRSSPMWSAGLVPETAAATAPPSIPLSEAVATALSRRSELAQVDIASDINLQDQKLTADQTKPQIDLVGTYTRAGLAGQQAPGSAGGLAAAFTPIIVRVNQLSAASGLPPIDLSALNGSATPPILIGGYGQSLSNLINGNFPTTQVQLRIAFPIRNRTAEANHDHSIAEGKRLRNQRSQLEQSIESDVRAAMQNVDSARLRLEESRTARQSAEEQYESEQRQFRAGTSTLFLVQQRQTTMIATRSQERRSESDLEQAIANYELAIGTNLQAHDITLDTNAAR